MKYKEMNDMQINKHVARALNVEWNAIASDGLIIGERSLSVNYCKNPSDIMPIAFENNISMLADSDYELDRNLQRFRLNFTGRYIASAFPLMTDGFNGDELQVIDKNPYRAIAICFLKMKDAEVK